MSYWYLATPFTLYPAGHAEAWLLACREAGRYIKAGIPVFSPIVHSYPIALICNIPADDQQLWLSADLPFMHAACGLIICTAEGWRESKGIAVEVDYFKSADRPVSFFPPTELLIPARVAYLRGIVERSGK